VERRMGSIYMENDAIEQINGAITAPTIARFKIKDGTEQEHTYFYILLQSSIH